MEQSVSIERTGHTMIVRFTQPETRNPLSRSVVENLHKIVDEVASSDVQRLIFTGSGDAFASGANLNEIAALSPDEAPEFARLGQALMKKIDELPQIVIAAINGHCFGGALDLALSCDIRIASPHATFAHPGAGLGIITGWSGTQRLPRLVGQGNALEMFFTAAPIDASHALRIGLLNSIAEDVVAAALSFDAG